MSLKLYSVDEKIKVVEDLLVYLRKNGGRHTQEHAVLTTIARDLRARRDFPRSNTLGSLERELATVIASKSGIDGYDHGRLIHLANMVVSRWSTISQALEQFGEECAE